MEEQAQGAASVLLSMDLVLIRWLQHRQAFFCLRESLR